MDKVKTESRNDEIDLVELFMMISKSIKKVLFRLVRLFVWIYEIILKFLSVSFKFIFSNIIVIIAFVVLGFILGTVVNSKIKPFYRTNAIIRTQLVKSSDLITYINRLNMLVN